MLQADGIQTDDTYIGHKKVTVDQWVYLHPTFEVCAQEQGFEGGGWQRITWRRQEAQEKVLWATLSEDSWEARMRQE